MAIANYKLSDRSFLTVDEDTGNIDIGNEFDLIGLTNAEARELATKLENIRVVIFGFEPLSKVYIYLLKCLEDSFGWGKKGQTGVAYVRTTTKEDADKHIVNIIPGNWKKVFLCEIYDITESGVQPNVHIDWDNFERKEQ